MKMNLGYIIQVNENNSGQDRWTRCYDTIFKEMSIEPHIISSPKLAREGYGYVWRPNHDYFDGKYKNTNLLSEKLSELAEEYEENGATLLPTSSDLSFYENKKKIMELCVENNIKIPKSYYCKSESEASKVKVELDFPILIKYPYSCSSYGLKRCASDSEYDLMMKQFFIAHGECIIQEELPITKDLRINFVGHQSLCSFWRVKVGDNYSSATKFGSHVDHFTIPWKGIEFANEIAAKLDIGIGGIDMAWENDDIRTEPYLLEVSPIFDINPQPLKPVKKWKRFKKSFWWNKLYFQNHLTFAARQIAYLQAKMSESSIK